MPMAMPAITVSASGVSMTRSGPNLPSNPRVARNTPPSTPTSSPSTTTSGSRAISWCSARFTASTRVISAMPGSLLCAARGGETPRLVALRHQAVGQPSVQVLEHGLGGRRRNRQVLVHRGLHLLGAGEDQCLLVILGPRALGNEPGAQ